VLPEVVLLPLPALHAPSLLITRHLRISPAAAVGDIRGASVATPQISGCNVVQ
jgi:hypothetical protein